MAALQDSLNYDRFDIVDSDDEDYVEKIVQRTALDPSSSSVATRNAAAHALAKQGKLGQGVTDTATSIDNTLSETRKRMEAQLASLNDEMAKLANQQASLSSVQSPEEAMSFIEKSGLSPEEIEEMITESGLGRGGGEKSKEINEATNKVEDMAAKISQLAKGEKTAKEQLDSDDEPEAEVSPLQTPTSSTASNTSSKRVLNDFEKAFAKNKFNNAISNPAPSSTKSPSPTVTPQYTVDYADSSFAVSIELPSVSSFSSCDLSVSSTALKLTAVKSNEEEEDQTEKYGLNYTFKHQIDEDSINAKFSKKKSRLTINGLLI